MDNIDYQKYVNKATDWAVGFVPMLILAMLILFIGFWLVKKLNLLIQRSLEKAKVETDIATFLGSMLDIVFKMIVILFAASFIGFQMSALLGVLAAAGFAIGLALQGFLGNFASGLTIIFFKPYKVGDWVQVSELFGKVSSIQIFNTTLVTPGDKTLIIPNGKVTDSIITNFSTQGNIRIELKVTMPYVESFPKVKRVIEDALLSCSTILHNPKPLIGIESYDSHNIVVAVRPYINPDIYWDATFEVYSALKQAFNQNNIQVAYSEGVELGAIGD